MSGVETGQMSSGETGQMSSVETGQMSAVETGQMTAAETSVLSQQRKAQVQSWLTKVRSGPKTSKMVRIGSRIDRLA